GGGLPARKRRETQSFSIAVDVDGARPLHAGDVGQRDRLAAANRSPIAGISELVQEVKPAAGMSWIDENRLAAIDQGRQRPGIVRVRAGGNSEHNQLGAARVCGDVGGQETNRAHPFLNPPRLDATLRAQRGEALRVAGVETHRVPPFAEVSSGGATAMSRAEN